MCTVHVCIISIVTHCCTNTVFPGAGFGAVGEDADAAAVTLKARQDLAPEAARGLRAQGFMWIKYGKNNKW